MSITIAMVVRAAWQNYADEYTAGATVAEISRKSQMSAATVTAHMKRLKVYVPGRKGGASKQSHCKRDHDMAVHGKLIDAEHPEKGSFCTECKRIRERKGP